VRLLVVELAELTAQPACLTDIFAQGTDTRPCRPAKGAVAWMTHESSRGCQERHRSTSAVATMNRSHGSLSNSRLIAV
jgi:hypothetical protein